MIIIIELNHESSDDSHPYRLRWAPSLSDQLLLTCYAAADFPGISGMVLVRLRSGIFIGYWSFVKGLNINSYCGLRNELWFKSNIDNLVKFVLKYK